MRHLPLLQRLLAVGGYGTQSRACTNHLCCSVSALQDALRSTACSSISTSRATASTPDQMTPAPPAELGSPTGSCNLERMPPSSHRRRTSVLHARPAQQLEPLQGSLQASGSIDINTSSSNSSGSNICSISIPAGVSSSCSSRWSRGRASGSHLLTAPFSELAPSCSSFSLQPSLTVPHACQPFMVHTRGVKSLKRSMKPLNVTATRLAVAPFLPPPSESELLERDKYKQAPILDTALPGPLPVVPRPPEFTHYGEITSEYRLDLQPVFAVVELAGKQFKVTVDDIIFVNHLADTAVNEVLALERVLLLGSLSETQIGRPYVAGGARVLAAVEEHFLDGKVHVFHFKKRNRYKKYHAPRPRLTALRVLRILGPGREAEEQQVASLPIRLYEDMQVQGR